MTPANVTSVIVPIQCSKGTELNPSLPLEHARELARWSKAESTLRGYRSDGRVLPMVRRRGPSAAPCVAGDGCGLHRGIALAG
jgi:hypothetical protein